MLQAVLMPPLDPDTSCERNPQVAVAMALFEGLNSGDLQAWQARLDPAFEGERVGNRALTREQTMAFQAALLEAFPSLSVSVHHVFESGNTVALHWSALGNHLRPLVDPRSGMSIPATGRGILMAGVLIQEIVEGRIRRVWNYYDRMALLEQLGLMPQ